MMLSTAQAATPAQQQNVRSPPAGLKTDNGATSEINSSASTSGPLEMFSPTSAAAWALSTLHNFGAATSADTAPRPSGNSLTGTRLFNNNHSGGVVDCMGAGTASFGTSGNNTFEGNTNGVNNNPLPDFTTFDRHARQPNEQIQTATSANLWRQLPPAHPSNLHLVDRSPYVGRCNFMPQAVGSMDYSMMASASGHYRPLARLVSTTSMVTPTPKKFKGDPTMFLVASAYPPGAAPPPEPSAYSRKKKSLGVLAENFLQSYRTMPSGSIIVVDEAAIELGVERRRIYDVVNILESVCMVSKKQKNTYSWMGMDQLDVVFGRLQAQAVLEYPEDAQRLLGSEVIEAGDDGANPPSPVPLKPPRRHSRSKENKSLAKLSQEFLQVFLVGHKTLSLPEASDKIQGTTTTEELIVMGGGPDVPGASLLLDNDGVNALQKPDARSRELKAAAARGLKTKIRRLYDIANVFLSVGLLRKVDSSDSSRRPNFSWNYKLDARQLHSLYNSRMGSKPPAATTPPSPSLQGLIGTSTDVEYDTFPTLATPTNQGPGRNDDTAQHPPSTTCDQNRSDESTTSTTSVDDSLLRPDALVSRGFDSI